MGNSQSSAPVITYVDRTAEKKRDAIEREESRIQRQRTIKSEKNDKVTPERNFLKSYTFGSMNGKASFKGFDISDMEHPGSLRIGLFGPAGAGKSSFIYSCERTLKEIIRGTADVKVAKAEGTIRVGDYLAGPWHFKLVDTRGFGEYDTGEINVFHDIIYGNIREGQKIDFANKNTTEQKGEPCDWIHSVIFVLSALDPYLWDDSLADDLNPFRAFMRQRGIAPITIITHKDELMKRQQENKVDKVMGKASIATGSAISHTFYMTNYIGTEEQNPDIELDICKILKVALTMGERYVRFAKHDQKKTNFQFQQMTIGGSGKNIRDFFRDLQTKHSLPEERVENIISQLEENAVRNEAALKLLWPIVQQRIHMSNAMKRYINEELK